MTRSASSLHRSIGPGIMGQNSVVIRFGCRRSGRTPKLEVTMNFIATLLLCLFGVPIAALSAPPARELLDKSNDVLFATPYIQRVDTEEKAATATVGDKRIGQPPTKTVLSIDIERKGSVARERTLVGGQELILLARGDKRVMKLGTDSWQVPTGQWEKMAKDLGNLFVCEQVVPETASNAPELKIVDGEKLDGIDAVVIESVGDSATKIAEQRMNAGVQKMLGDQKIKIAIKVLSYSMRKWLAKDNLRPLQNIQHRRFVTTITLPDGKTQVTETESVGTSKYTFDQTPIEIPDEAGRLLSDNTAAKQ
ncbi:MAG: hypothetical protein HQM09_14665 [Candidatus Riflebacteria bacterium]|nr:hypothetical protein [Candidatus Riflebacteria bacterium]